MKSLNAHLAYPGHASEAMAFYQELFGGDLSLVESQEDDGKVFHADLRGPNFRLMAADAEQPRLALHIVCDDRAEMERFVQRLSETGSLDCGIETAFGGLYAEVTDRFGTHWYLTLPN